MGLFKKNKQEENKQEENTLSENKTDNKKKSNKNNNESQNINTNKVKILVFRYVGEDLAVQIGKPMIAEERRDENNNLLVINEQANFKEDLNFSIDRVYEIMNFSLKMQNKNNKEKAIVLRKEIKYQEEFLLKFEEESELNATHNYRDEELKLKQLKIFYDSLRKEKRGNYMRIGESGIRQFEFVAIDGILYPYFFGGKRFRVYPDLLVKKKIFNHENTIYKNENAALFQTSLNWMLVILYVVGILLLVVEVGAGYYVYQKNADIEMKINNGAITCLNALGTFTANYGDTLEDYMKSKSGSETTSENSEKNQNNINNKIPIINIDPDNLNQNK